MRRQYFVERAAFECVCFTVQHGRAGTRDVENGSAIGIHDEDGVADVVKERTKMLKLIEPLFQFGIIALADGAFAKSDKLFALVGLAFFRVNTPLHKS